MLTLFCITWTASIKATNVDAIYSYSLLMIAGISILNVFRPLFGIAAYISLTALYGPIGAAFGNIVTYSVMSILLIIFIMREYPIKLKLELITKEERSLLKAILNKLRI